MKAAVIEKQGGLENLVYRDWPDPIPREGEVLLRVSRLPGGCFSLWTGGTRSDRKRCL
jgi:hypothetical protein